LGFELSTFISMLRQRIVHLIDGCVCAALNASAVEWINLWTLSPWRVGCACREGVCSA
jgi:hypothetical protein